MDQCKYFIHRLNLAVVISLRTLCAFKDALLQSGYLYRGHRTWPAGVINFSLISHGVSQEVVLKIHTEFQSSKKLVKCFNALSDSKKTDFEKKFNGFKTHYYRLLYVMY